MHVFHIAPFPATRYVLTCFRCLKVSNRVSIWSKVNYLIFMKSIRQICQFEIPILINKLIFQCSLWITISYVFCEFHSLAAWNKGKTVILVRLSFGISQLIIPVFYTSLTYLNLKTCVPRVILKEPVVLMCLASHFDTIQVWKLIIGHRVICYGKKFLNFFLYEEVRNLVEKWNIYESHFPEIICTNMLIGNDFLVFKYPVTYKQKFSHSIYFY